MKIEWKEPIGTPGRSGTVWRGLDTELKREVAVKFFHSSLDGISERIAAHAASLAMINHPNVVHVYGIDELVRPGQPAGAPAEHALIMEFVPGQTFADWLNKPNLSKAEVKQVIYDVLAGLEEFHRLNLGHGDLHGKNILIDNGHAKLLDPVESNPQIVLSTQSMLEKKQFDMRFARNLLGQALLKVTPNTMALGAFYAPTEECTIHQLRQNVGLALKEGPRGTSLVGQGTSVASFYDLCRAAQSGKNETEWQELRKIAIASMQPSLNAWKAEHYKENEELSVGSLQSLFRYLPEVMGFLLAAAECPISGFNSETSVLRRFMQVDWPNAGRTDLIAVPQFVIYILHHLAGAAAAINRNFISAMGLFRLRLPLASRSDLTPLFQNRGFVAGPSINTYMNMPSRFRFIRNMFSDSAVLRSVFPDDFSFASGLGAYSLFLTLFELVQDDPTQLLQLPVRRDFNLRSWPNFIYLSEKECSEAMTLLFYDATVLDLLIKNGRFSKTQLETIWPKFALACINDNRDQRGIPHHRYDEITKVPW